MSGRSAVSHAAQRARQGEARGAPSVGRACFLSAETRLPAQSPRRRAESRDLRGQVTRTPPRSLGPALKGRVPAQCTDAGRPRLRTRNCADIAFCSGRRSGRGQGRCSEKRANVSVARGRFGLCSLEKESARPATEPREPGSGCS